jgi:hypothetical protein
VPAPRSTPSFVKAIKKLVPETRQNETPLPYARASAATLPGQARTVKARTRFLAEFARCGNVLRSAESAGMGRARIYEWLKGEAFKALYAAAHEDALDQLEEEARRRAVDGVFSSVYQGGKKVGTVTEYSDTLLKGKRPDTFRERVEHTEKAGKALTVEVVRRMSDEEIDREFAELAVKAVRR